MGFLDKLLGRKKSEAGEGMAERLRRLGSPVRAVRLPSRAHPPPRRPAAARGDPVGG